LKFTSSDGGTTTTTTTFIIIIIIAFVVVVIIHHPLQAVPVLREPRSPLEPPAEPFRTSPTILSARAYHPGHPNSKAWRQSSD